MNALSHDVYVYAASKLSSREHTQVQRVKDEGMYSCGVSLCPDSHPLRHSVVVKEALKCSSLLKQHITVHPEFVSMHAVCIVGLLMIWLTMWK